MSTACTSCPSASPGRRASRSLWYQNITKFGGLGRTLETKEANPYLLEKVPGALGEKNFPVVSAITGLWLAAHIFPGEAALLACHGPHSQCIVRHWERYCPGAIRSYQSEI